MARRDHHDIIVIGASMGGVEALSQLVAQFPKDLPASICVVLHVAAEHRSFLPEILSRIGPLPARHPHDYEPLEHGRIYVAPNDHHLMVEVGHVRVVKGPLENGHRPAVDPLFRSAARAYGPRVVGVVLTGALNCGTVGLLSVKDQGGIAVVQDPVEATCGDMPRSALEYVNVDHCVRLGKMGELLTRLVKTPLRTARRRHPPKRLEQEVEALLSHREATNKAPPGGSPSHFSCPDCGGILFELKDSGLLRYRCRVGHGYTSEALASGQEEMVDSALWAAVRALEENAALARRMAKSARERNHHHSARRYEERALSTERQAMAVRLVATRGAPLSASVPSASEKDEGSPERSN
jgi:two-component system chemotaxis response regulator CheB